MLYDGFDTFASKQNELIKTINSYGPEELIRCLDYFKVDGVAELSLKQLNKWILIKEKEAYKKLNH